RHFLQERCSLEPTPDDLLYVYNFETPHRPQAISLPPGQGNAFCESMKQLIEAVELALTQAFESSSYRELIHGLEKKFMEQREQKLDALERKATDLGFDIQETPSGLAVMINAEDEPNDSAAVNHDNHENGEPLPRRETQRNLQAELQNILREIRVVEREAREERRHL